MSISVAEYHALLKKQPKGRARRPPPGEMNGVESRYAQHLEMRKRGGDIADWKFEAFTLKLAHDCRFTPDFWILENSGHQTFIDVKGTKRKAGIEKPYSTEDAALKIRWAASMFPCFKFLVMFERVKGIWSAVEAPATGAAADQIRAAESSI